MFVNTRIHNWTFKYVRPGDRVVKIAEPLRGLEAEVIQVQPKYGPWAGSIRVKSNIPKDKREGISGEMIKIESLWTTVDEWKVVDPHGN